MDLKTPLYDIHAQSGGQMVSFAGYLLPVQYKTGILTEHNATRTKAGLFDVSHMGEVMFTGSDALKNLNNIFTNDFTNMTDGRVRYSPMCNDEGGVLDDMIIYRLDSERYMVVVNAANRHKDVEWMKERLSGNVIMEDISDQMAQIALQGPLSPAILQKLCGEIPQKYYSFVESAIVAGKECLLSQTGYTGETGYGLYCKPRDAVSLWNSLLEAGSAAGLIPCGLGARDTLRLEAGMPLYGHEMNQDISPLETGLDFAVKMSKPDFIGKTALQKRGAVNKKRVGLKVTGRGIARENCKVYHNGAEAGITTSGTHAPFLGYPVAMALLELTACELGTQVEIEVRGRRIEAEIVPLPFYKKK